MPTIRSDLQAHRNNTNRNGTQRIRNGIKKELNNNNYYTRAVSGSFSISYYISYFSVLCDDGDLDSSVGTLS